MHVLWSFLSWQNIHLAFMKIRFIYSCLPEILVCVFKYNQCKPCSDNLVRNYTVCQGLFYGMLCINGFVINWFNFKYITKGNGYQSHTIVSGYIDLTKKLLKIFSDFIPGLNVDVSINAFVFFKLPAKTIPCICVFNANVSDGQKYFWISLILFSFYSKT